MNNLQVSSSNSPYSLDYFFTLIVVIVVCNLLLKKSPQMNTIVVLLLGLVIGFISLTFFQHFLPRLTDIGTSIYLYYTYQIMNNFNSTGYYHVWPPILAILVVFIILLYNRQLG